MHSGKTLTFDNTKAGLQGLDKTAIEAVINDASRGSAFYANEERKNVERKERIDGLLSKSKSLSQQDLRKSEDGVNKLIATLERERRLGTYIHVDMDAFFCAVEERQNPALKSQPFAVGGLSMLSTSNYVARQFGVRAAMPGYVAKKLCPDLIIVSGHMELYRQVSLDIQKLLEKYDPHFSCGGLDEFTLNVGESKDPEDLSRKIREEIHETTGLTASCGIASTPTLAKIVAGFNKPNGQYRLVTNSVEELTTFIHQLPVRKMPGVGKVTERLLHSLGVTTFADFHKDRVRLHAILTPKCFEFLLRSSLGVGYHCAFGHSEPGVEALRKSISLERTFYTMDADGLTGLMRHLTEKVVEEMVAEDRDCDHVGLKLKYKTFQLTQQSCRIAPTRSLDRIWGAVESLLRPHLGDSSSFRLAGVRLGLVIPTPPSPSKQQLHNSILAWTRKRKREIVEITSDSEDETVVSDSPPIIVLSQ
jgi:DNA polymerase kappa